MNSINLYPFGPPRQAMLAAVVFTPQLLVTEKSQVADKLVSTKVPVEYIIDFEDHRNHGIGD
jgi:hypothetical protein